MGEGIHWVKPSADASGRANGWSQAHARVGSLAVLVYGGHALGAGVSLRVKC